MTASDRPLQRAAQEGRSPVVPVFINDVWLSSLEYGSAGWSAATTADDLSARD